jgi:hypothetical protein
MGVCDGFWGFLITWRLSYAAVVLKAVLEIGKIRGGLTCVLGHGQKDFSVIVCKMGGELLIELGGWYINGIY